MAEKAKKSARPKNDALVTWRMESFPISVSQNKQYTDKVVDILNRRVRRNPAVFSYYNKGRLVWLGSSQQGITPQIRSGILKQARMHSFDRFSVYTLAKRRHANDIEALVSHVAWPEKSTKTFTRAKNLGDVARKDVRHWANSESRKISRQLRPLERRYKKSMSSIERKEMKTRKSYLKRIMKAKDKMRQKKLRVERDRKLKVLSTQRKRLQPWRNNITAWTAKWRTYQNIKV